ncbi:MAG: hypothetical protein LUC93_03220 [Planctomycetaceae bacterium]|nr:hypothetical protein [Planctomycetaceae bacterium]
MSRSRARLKRTVIAGEGGEEAAEGVVGGGEDAGDVFPNNESWSNVINRLHKAQGKIAPVVVQRLPAAGNGKSLTGRAADNHVAPTTILCPVVHSHVADVGDIGVVVRQDGRRERFNLRKTYRLPPQRDGGHGDTFDTGEKAYIPNHA